MQDRSWLCVFVLSALLLLSLPVAAQEVKGPLHPLDNLTFQRPGLRVVETPSDTESIRDRVPNLKALDAFRAEYGMEWRIVLDERRGAPTLMEGGAIRFIPGSANNLRWEEYAPGCGENACLPLAVAEGVARSFLLKHAEILRVDPAELSLDPDGSGPFGNNVYFLRFRWLHGGLPVEGASVILRINGGNLIQVTTENTGDITLDSAPALSPETAWQNVQGYLGAYASAEDRILQWGDLFILPVTPDGLDPDFMQGPYGTMTAFKLVYRFSFHRKGVIGTWEALVDAHTGEVLRFADANRYGHVHGGIRPSDGLPPEENRPFPFVDTGLPAPDDYTDSAGNFAGTSATVTLQGKYVRMADSCGTVSAATTTGDIDFGSGASGTDCTVPAGNTYGAGNTKPSRTLYYYATAINLKAQTYSPSNSWLTGGYVTIHVNGNAWCNAQSGGANIYFYKAATGCNNLGEIPGVAMHEWAHSYDSADGSGGQCPPVETYADWTAILQTHNSCIGAGFRPASNCSGYGDACLDCTGVRDADYDKHFGHTPWTSSNQGTLWTCSGGSYFGPCGWEDHCESGLSTQALWDFVTRDLVGTPMSPSPLDLTSAWMLEDRLWFKGVATLTKAYNCAGGVTDGCTGNVLYAVMRAVDDDGDGLANGTPHAHAIYHALARHNIACGADGDAVNQNHVSDTCPSMAVTTLSGTAGSSKARLSWPPVAGATRYMLYRNETGCDAGFTRIAVVNHPTLAYTDTAAVNGVTYYYRMQAATANDSCTSAVSNCATVTPIPCTAPGTPGGISAAPDGDNRIRVAWTAGSPAGATYRVLRAVNAACGSATDFTEIASGLTAAEYTDTTVSGGTTYSYKVSALDVTTDCESSASPCADAAATGACTGAPLFVGLSSVSNNGGASCSLTLSWSAATALCPGPVTFNVYRDTASPFTPSPANRIASFVTGTSYTDANGLATGTTYYYIVKAADRSNGAEDANLVVRSGRPTGATVVVNLAENFETVGGFDLAGWTHGVGQGTVDWAWNTAQSNTPTHSWYSQSTNGPAERLLVSPSFLVGASTTLSFYHTYDFEWDSTACYDAGTLEISTDGGTTWATVPDAAFTAGGFNGTASGCCSSPIAGKRAWCNGDIGTMTQVSVNLSSYAGTTAKIRWREGDDEATFNTGWYVDTVRINNALTQDPCASVSAPPVVPNGASGAQPMRGSKLDASGNQIAITWDDSACRSDRYKVVYGTGAQLPASYTGTYGVTGSVCTSGGSPITASPLTWDSVPSADPATQKFLWWIVVAADAAGTVEGSWGINTGAQERTGPGASGNSGQCGATGKSLLNTCGM